MRNPVGLFYLWRFYVSISQTNINNIVVDVKTKDGTFSRRTLQFNDADWKMYLEVKDTNGDRAVFTPNNSNGTIRIKKNGTNTDITTLKLVQGRVTKQMNKGIIESSKHNFDMFKGGYGSPSYNTNQWKPEYFSSLWSVLTRSATPVFVLLPRALYTPTA